MTHLLGAAAFLLVAIKRALRRVPAPPQDIFVTHGKGSWLFSNDGKKYLDLASGRTQGPALSSASACAPDSRQAPLPTATVRALQLCNLQMPPGNRAANRRRPLLAGIGVTSTGHCHPRVVAAVQEQAAKVVHAQQVRRPLTLPAA